ncbi:MAG: primosomal protein N' [Bacteroidales bacterium]
MDRVKEIIEVTGDTVNEQQLLLWRWMSEYYLCTMGEVMNAAMPAGLKVESRTVISLPAEIAHEERLDSASALILEILKKEGSISLNKLPATIEGESVLKVVGRLVNQGVVVAGERAVDRYIPREEIYISLSEEYDEAELHRLLDSLAKTPARLKLVNTYLTLTGYDGRGSLPTLKKSLLLSASGSSAAPLAGLIKKGTFKVILQNKGRIRGWTGSTAEPNKLSIDQSRAFSEINDSFGSNSVTLLRGVTSSGKTEIYIHLIREAIEKGKQALFLLPEIAITTQMINRLKRHFGDSVGVYHSGFSDNERVEVWRRTAETNGDEMFRIILGVRSSIFLPFHSLGLVIVDEEHDNSYKQQDPAPRYSARDSAIMLAKFHNAKTVLGSATPSIESVYNARRGKYGYVEMNDRFGEVKMPEMILSDTRDAYRRKQMVSHFTPQMIAAIEEALEKKEQVVLFRNRRGYAPVIQCRECGWMPGCKSCSVNLTYHRGLSRMRCHYCGYSTPVPRNALHADRKTW